ncbi:MAG: glycosyltransferase family 9 protein [Planctomycetes bacterium]|nr:glycosyltransferase family 9 protein [Planctomycetota bacterium]
MDFNKILIVRLSAIGDVINTIPALTALRQNFPKSFIGWVVEDKAGDLLVGNPYLDQVFVWHRRSHGKITKALGLIQELRRHKFDVAIDFQGNLKSGLITSLSRAKILVGMKPAKEGNALFTNHKVTLPDKKMNRVERNLYILNQLGVNTGVFNWRKIPSLFSPADKAHVDEFLTENNPSNKPIIILHPGTSEFGLFKRWAPAKYAQLADRLTQKFKAICIISWAGKEKPLAESISAQMQSKPLIFAEQISLNKLAALVKRAELFIGSDSAPVHLANLLGCNVLGLYGPKDPAIYAPYHLANAGNKIAVVRKDLPCSPCQKRRCDKPTCMESITVEEVFREALKILR